MTFLGTVVAGRPEPIGQPVFIVGCGHSGTTLLLAILSRHPDLYSVPYESSMMRRRPSDVDWFVHQFNRATRDAGKSRWVEKTPLHVHHIESLLERFPTGQVVVLLRDGRDVAASLERRFGDLDRAVARWLSDTAAADPWLDHERVILVRYEDLVADSLRALESLCEWLGIGYDDALLEVDSGDFRFAGRFEAHRSFIRQLAHEGLEEAPDPRDNHRAYRSQQAAQPIFDGRARWQSDLTAATQARFKELAGDRLVAYGYESDDTW